MEQLWTLILSDGGWVALAIILIILFVFAPIARLFLKLGARDDMSDKAIVTQAVTVAELSAASIQSQKSQDESLRMIGIAMDRMSQVIEKQQTQIDDISQRTDSISQRTDNLKADLGTAVADMRVSATALSERVGGVPQKVREVLLDDFEKLPSEVDKVIKPRIETLQREIESKIAELITELKETPTKTTELMQSNFDAFLAGLTPIIKDIVSDAIKVAVRPEPTINAAPAAEDKPNE